MEKINSFKTSLASPDEFTITYELVPGQGIGGRQVDRLLEFARLAGEDGRIKALSITDNPGGAPALAPVAIGSEILEMGIEPLIHFSLKDKNRNQVESHIFLYQRLQLHSLLVLGGDYPRPGYYGQARAVYDLDTIQTLQLMRDMESGSYFRQQHKNSVDLRIPALFKGCVVSPFKTTEAEQVWQYAKLLHKVRAGADFIITQLGFDVTKLEELMTFCREYSINLPVLANIFVPSLPVARAMAAGRVPGVVISKEFLAVMEDEAARGESRLRLQRAAAMLRTARNMGYSGVHIGGNGLSFDDLKFIMDQAEQSPQPSDNGSKHHFPAVATWHLYRQQQKAPETRDRPPLHPGTKPGAVKLHRLSHHLLFSRKTLSGRLMKQFILFAAKGKLLSQLLKALEQCIKWPMFHCKMCGDCTLEYSAYLCPQSGCPKKLVNGPCGGSLHGNCEVFPEQPCFWVRVYERLELDTTLDALITLPVLPPKDWRLENSSSWINFFKK